MLATCNMIAFMTKSCQGYNLQKLMKVENMSRYKISELAQLWGCSVPTVHKRVEKEGYKTIQALDEQNKMVKYVIIDDVENNVNNVENHNKNDDVIDVIPIESNSFENSPASKFVEAIMTLTHEHEKIISKKNEELAKYQASALLLEDKKYTEGLLMEDNKELKQKNRELEREQKNLQKVNDYLKYAIFVSIIVIVGLLVHFIR